MQVPVLLGIDSGADGAPASGGRAGPLVFDPWSG